MDKVLSVCVDEQLPIICLQKNSRSFIVLIPCDTLWETLVLLGFLIQVSFRVYGLVFYCGTGAFEVGWCPSWHHSNPPGIKHRTSLLKDPCPTHCTMATPQSYAYKLLLKEHNFKFSVRLTLEAMDHRLRVTLSRSGGDISLLNFTVISCICQTCRY